MQPEKLKVQYVGPIKVGCTKNGGFVTIDRLTVFIGGQGMGKSTFCKLYDTLSRIEKALTRGYLTFEYLNKHNRFKKHFEYQGIDKYINEKSVIDYIGKYYRISFINNKLKIKNQDNDSDFLLPKIIYIPAERNFISAVDRPDLISRLPKPLFTFLEEYFFAQRRITKIDLPINGLKFEHRSQNNKSYVVGTDYKIDLLEAASGIQSLVPMFLVTESLTRELMKKPSSHSEKSLSRKRKFDEELLSIMNEGNLSEKERGLLFSKLLKRTNDQCLKNIVEEPEQNLYPSSQKAVLFEFLKSVNKIQENQLLISTHSPFIINYLTLATKAFQIQKKASKNTNADAFESLYKIVPKEAMFCGDTLNVYQLDRGKIEELPNYKGLPNDENALNEDLGDFNDSFSALLTIEDDLCQ